MPRTWLITGSSRGLGRELVKVVLDAGHQVLTTARDPATVADLVALAPDRARAVALDVTDRAASAAAIAAAVDAFGSLDVLVNNAGYAQRRTRLRTSTRTTSAPRSRRTCGAWST